MSILNLDNLKRREEQLKIPVVDMALVLTLFLAVGILAAALVILGTVSRLHWGSLVLLLWQLAIFMAAASVGFLFGHPRVVRAPASTPAPKTGTPGAGGTTTPGATTTTATNPDDPNRPPRLLDPSTALQDIVDWLTKIIVGLGLVELRRVPELVRRTASVMDRSVAVVAGSPGDYSGLAVGVIVASSGCGFVFGYLMTRLYLQGAINRADESLSRQQKEAIQERLDVARRLTVADQTPTDAFTLDSPEVWNQDPNKGQFGKQANVNGWLLSAVIQPALGPNDPVCNVNLTCRAEKDPGRATVTFYLHPSFRPHIVSVPVAEGQATLDIVASGVFTVGAEVQTSTGTTRLELDLATVKGGTPRFYEQ